MQTVIEALKFATTGILPPNSAQGKTFVHDPKVCDREPLFTLSLCVSKSAQLENETEMSAQVKIKFRSFSSFPIVSTRQV